MELPFTLENKRRNTSFKSTILDPQKSAFLVFVEIENPKKKNFFVFRPWFSFKNNRRTNVLLIGIFENAQKKLLTPKNAILAVNNVFLCVFKNTDLNNICASVVFKDKRKIWRNIFCLFFISKLKNALFGGSINFFSSNFYIFSF